MHEKLIERLREYPDREETAGGYVEVDWQDLLDAADAIESLTAQLSALQSENGLKDQEIERIKVEFQYKQSECDSHYGDYCEAKAELSRMEAERDAAMEYVPQTCSTCKHKKNGVCGMGCEFARLTINYAERCNWEWRGAQGEG